jgi:iron complex outermembrane receptor protein
MLNGHKWRSAMVRGSVVGTALIASVGAYAQTSEPERQSSGELAEIQVTAQRTSSTVQETPIAVTAVDARLLEERQVISVKDVGAIVPGLLVEPVTTTSNSARIVLRGVGQENSGILYDPAVGVYVDDVYQPRLNGMFFDFFDVERVEVLRGPQGTLYGRNTSGGAIKLVSRTPSLDRAEGGGDISFGNYNALSLRGYASVPLVTDKLALSASFVKRERDGIIRSTNTGERLGDIDSLAARTKLHYKPTDALTMTFSLDYMQDRGDPGIGVPIAVGPGVNNPNARPDRSLYWSELDGPQASDLDSVGFVANIRYDINDYLTFSSITGYRSLDMDQAAEYSWSATSRLGGDYTATDESFSQEFTLEIDAGRLKGVAGLYYFKEEGDQTRGYLTLPPGYIYSTRHDVHRESEAYAVFAELNYELFDGFNVIGGIRWTKEDAYLSQVYPTVYNVLQAAEDSFDDVTPKIGFNWDVAPDTMIYATYTEGFKSGGFNTLTPNVNPATGERIGPEVFDPETVESYEAGIKLTTPNRKARLNVALFQANYEGVQLPAFLPGTIISTVRNATSARIEGVEIEPTWRATDNLEFFGALSFLSGKYTGPYTCANAWATWVDCSQNKIKGLIPTQATIGFTYTPEWDIPGEVSIGGDWRYTSFYYNNVSNQPLLGQSEAVGIWQGFIKWTSSDERWSVALEGRNLADKMYYKNAMVLSNAISPTVTAYPSDPRMVNVRVGFKF